MMNILLLLCLLSLITLVNSRCGNFQPRKEGFLRKHCIPGYYEGSCLLILESKQTLHEAITQCQNEYGGRLATAPTEEAVQHWIRTIYFNHHDAGQNAKYWIGYGRSGFRNIAPKGESRWANVFNSTTFMTITQWENGANKNLLDDSDCPHYGTVFNPTSKKFDVKSYGEEHFALCETVRWAKLQCNTGWYLLQPIRMCVNVHSEYATFLQAHAMCNQEGSFIATAQNDEDESSELALLRNVIVPLNLRNDLEGGIGGFWAGLKSEGRTTFSMDGTEPLFTVRTTNDEKLCVAFTYRNFFESDGGEMRGVASTCVYHEYYINDYEKIVFNPFSLPYMCQRFADQSSIKNIQ